jgi:hypothetical protein
MMPVSLQPEPESFAVRVTAPGLKFLQEIANPTIEQWKGREYWQQALPDMRKAYQGLCAYCAHWIPHSTGNHSIDHFIPKSHNPTLAYTWSNFRYIAARFNSRKGTRTILDPFQLLPDWFVLDFASFLIRAHPDLQPEQKTAVSRTIQILRLNSDDDLVFERQSWIVSYQQGDISFAHLQRHAPFIAYELQRQGLLINVERGI